MTPMIFREWSEEITDRFGRDAVVDAEECVGWGFSHYGHGGDQNEYGKIILSSGKPLHTCHPKHELGRMIFVAKGCTLMQCFTCRKEEAYLFGADRRPTCCRPGCEIPVLASLD